eukprot:3742318-Amphidinium_carterae.2
MDRQRSSSEVYVENRGLFQHLSRGESHVGGILLFRSVFHVALPDHGPGTDLPQHEVPRSRT